MSKPVKISEADYERLKAQGHFKNYNESDIAPRVVDELNKRGHIREPKPVVTNDEIQTEVKDQPIPVQEKTPPKTKEEVTQDKSTIAKGIESVGSAIGEFNTKLKESAPLAGPVAANSYGVIANTITTGIPSLVSSAYNLGKGLVTVAKSLNPIPSADRAQEQIKAVDFAKTISQFLLNTVGGVKPYVDQKIAEITGNEGAAAFNKAQQNQVETDVQALLWDKDQTNKFAESIVTDDIFNAIQIGQENAQYKFDKPEGYEDVSAKEYLNPFTEAGFYTYMQGLPSIGFTLASMGVTGGAVALGESLGGKLASIGIKDAIKKKAKQELGAKLGSNLGYITSLGVNVDNEARIETYDTYKTLYDKQLQTFTDKLVAEGMPKFAAEKQVITDRHKEMHERALKSATNVYTNNMMWLLTTQHLQNKLLGVAPKAPGYNGEISEQTIAASTALKRLLNNPIVKTIGSSTSEMVEEGYQTGLQIYERNNVFDDPQGPSYVHGLANGIKDGILNFNDQEAIVSKAMGFITSGPITAIQEKKEADRYNKLKDQYNASIQYINAMRNTTAFKINDNLDEPTFGNINIKGLEHIVKTEDLLTLQSHSEIAKLKTTPNATIYHHALGDMAEDEVLQNRLFKILEESDVAEPVSSLMEDYKREITQSGNNEFYYEGTKLDATQLIKRKHAVLEFSHMAWKHAKTLSEGKDNAGVFRHAFTTRANRLNTQARYRDLAEAEANKLATSETPYEIELRDKYHRIANTFDQEVKRYQKELNSVSQSITAYQAEQVASTALANTSTPEEAKQAIPQLTEDPQVANIAESEIIQTITQVPVDTADLKQLYETTRNYPELLETADEKNIDPEIVNEIISNKINEHQVKYNQPVYDSTSRKLGAQNNDDPFIDSYVRTKFNNALKDPKTSADLIEAVTNAALPESDKEYLINDIKNKSLTHYQINKLLETNTGTDKANTPTILADKILLKVLNNSAISLEAPIIPEEHLNEVLATAEATDVDPRILTEDLKETYELDPKSEAKIEANEAQFRAHHTNQDPNLLVDQIAYLETAQQAKDEYVSNASYYIKDGLYYKRITTITGLEDKESNDPTDKSSDRFHATNIGNMVDIIAKAAFVSVQDPDMVANALYGKHIKWKNTNGQEHTISVIDALTQLKGQDERPLEQTDIYEQYLGETDSIFSFIQNYAKAEKTKGYIFFPNVFQTKLFKEAITKDGLTIVGYAGEADIILLNTITGHLHEIDIKTGAKPTSKIDILYQRQLALNTEPLFDNGIAERANTDMSIMHFELTPSDPTNRHIRTLAKAQVITMTQKEKQDVYNSISDLVGSNYSEEPVKEAISTEIISVFDGIQTPVDYSFPIQLPNLAVNSITMPNQNEAWYTKALQSVSKISNEQAIILGKQLLSYDNKESLKTNLALVSDWQAIELFRRYEFQIMMNQGLVDIKDMGMVVGGTDYIINLLSNSKQTINNYLNNLWDNLPIDIVWKGNKIASLLSTAKEFSNSVYFIKDTAFETNQTITDAKLKQPLRTSRQLLFKQLITPYFNEIAGYDISKVDTANPNVYGESLWGALNGNDITRKNAALVFISSLSRKRNVALTSNTGPKGITGFMPILEAQRKLNPFKPKTATTPAVGAATGKEISLKNNPLYEIIFNNNIPYSITNYGSKASLILNTVDFREGNEPIDYKLKTRQHNKLAIKSQSSKRPVIIDLNKTVIADVPAINKVIDYIESHPELDDALKLKALQTIYLSNATLSDLKNLDKIRQSIVNVLLISNNNVLFPEVINGKLEFKEYTQEDYLKHLIDLDVFRSDINPWVFENITIGYGQLQRSAENVNQYPEDLLKVSDEALGGTRDEASITKWFKERFEEFTREVLPESEIRDILNIRGFGHQVWGATRDAMTYIAQGAPDWVTRHEAMHLVQLTMLTSEQYQDLLNEGAERYGIARSNTARVDLGYSISKMKSEAEAKGLTAEEFYDSLPGDIQILEAMGDEFGYLIDNRIAPKTILGKIGAWFTRLYNLLFKNNYLRLKNYITDKITIDELFYQVDANTFGRGITAERLKAVTKAIENNKQYKSNSVLSINDWTSQKINQEINYINRDIIGRIVDKEGVNSLYELVDVNGQASKLLKRMYNEGRKTMSDTELDNLEKDIAALEDTSNDAEVIREMLNEIYNVQVLAELENDLNQFDPESNQYNELSNVIENYKNNKNFRYNLYKDLQYSHNITVQANTLIEDLILDPENEEISNSDIDANENDNADLKTKEKWQVDQAKENPLTFGRLANYYISNIPKVIKHINPAELDGTNYNDPRQHKLIQHKYQRTHRGNYVYESTKDRERILLHALSGILNRAEMMERLNALTKAHPWISILNHRLASNKSLATEMFIKYSNRYKIDYYKVDFKYNTSNNYLLNDSETPTYYIRYIINGIQTALSNTKILGTTYSIVQETNRLNNSVVTMFNKYQAVLKDHKYVSLADSSMYTIDDKPLPRALAERARFLIAALSNAYNAMGLNISKEQIKNEYETTMLTNSDELNTGIKFFANLVGTPTSGVMYLLDFFKRSAIEGKVINIGDPLKGNALSIAANSIKPYIKPERLDMFIDGKGNKVSSYSYPMYATRLFKTLQKNTRKNQLYSNSVFGKNNPLLAQIKKGLVSHVLLHEYTGTDSLDNTTNIPFEQLKDIDLALYLLSSWSSNTEAKPDQQKINHYSNKPVWLGAKSDSALGWAISVPALDKVTILHNTVKLIKAVIENIKREEKNNILYNTKAPQYYASIINQLKSEDKLNTVTSDEVYKLAEQYYDTQTANYMTMLNNSQLFNKSGITKIGVTTAMGLSYNNTEKANPKIVISNEAVLNAIVQDFVYNNSYYLNAYNQLILQSLNDFKDESDLAKRLNTDTRTGTFYHEIATYGTNAPLSPYYEQEASTVMFLNDYSSKNEVFLASIKDQYGEDSVQYQDLKESNATDNMGYHTLPYRREHEMRAGTWTALKEAYYNHEQRDKGKISKYKPDFEVIKPRWISADIRDKDMLYHTDVKNAETIISRQYAYKEKTSNQWSVPKANDVIDQYSKYENPQLAFLLHLMESRGANKMTFGGAKINKQASKLNDIFNPDGTLNIALLNSQEVITLDESDYMIQTAIPNKYKKKNIQGIQQINMLYAAVDLSGTYTEPGTNKSISGQETVDLIESIQASFFTSATQEFVEKTNDLNDISEAVYNNSQIGSNNPEYYDILSTKTVNGVTTFKTVPYHPGIGKYVESTLQAMGEKPKIQKMEGFVGNLQGNFDDPDLEYIIKDGKAEEVQLAMTYYSNAINEFAKANKISYEKALEQFLSDSSKNELFTGVTYRIPTEAMYSIFKSRVTKTLPQALGGSVKGPMVFLKIAGMDADSDKLYSAMYILSYDKATNDVYISYDKDTEIGLHNIKVNLAKQIYGTEAITKEGLTIGGTKDFLIARDELNLKLKLDPLNFIDNIKSYSYVQDSQDIISISAASQSINNYLTNSLDIMALTHPIGLVTSGLSNLKSSIKGRRFNSTAIASGTDVTKTPTLNYELGLNSETISPALMMGYLLGHTNLTQQELTNYIVKFMTHPAIRKYVAEIPVYESQVKEYRKNILRELESELFSSLSAKDRLNMRSAVLAKELTYDELVKMGNKSVDQYTILVKYIALKDNATYKTTLDNLIRAMNNKKISTSGSVANELAAWQRLYNEANEYDAMTVMPDVSKYNHKARLTYSKDNKTILPKIAINDKSIEIYKNSSLPRVAAYVNLLQTKINRISKHVLMMRPDALNFIHEITKHLGKEALSKKELKYITEGVINYIYARSIFSGSEYNPGNTKYSDQQTRMLRVREAYRVVSQYMLANPEYINNLTNQELANIEELRPLFKSIFIKEIKNISYDNQSYPSDYIVMFKKIIDPTNNLENYRNIFKWIREELPETSDINKAFKEFAVSLEDYIVAHWGLHYKGGNPAKLLPLSTLTTERYNESIKKVVDNELDFRNENIENLYSKKRIWQFLVMNNNSLAQYVKPVDIIPVGNIAAPHIQAYELIKKSISTGIPVQDIQAPNAATNDEVIMLNPNSSVFIRETERNNIDPTILKYEEYIAPRYIKYKGKAYEATAAKGLYLQLPKRGNEDIFEIYPSNLNSNKHTNHLGTRMVLPDSNYKTLLNIIVNDKNFKTQAEAWKDKYDPDSDPIAKLEKIQNVIHYTRTTPQTNNTISAAVIDSQALYLEYESIPSEQELISKDDFMKATSEEQQTMIDQRKKC